MKKYIEIFKEVRGNKRKKALFSLILWFVFFLMLFALIGRPPENLTVNDYSTKNSNSITSTGSSINNYNLMENFEFSYLIEITENNVSDVYKVNGTYYDGKYYFTIDNINYYLDNNVVYIVNEIDKQLQEFSSIDTKNILNRFDVTLLTKSSIYTMITSSEEETKTSYKDGTIVKSYIYTNHDSTTVNITTTEYSDILNNVTLDYTNYFKNANYQAFKVTCNYQNINNIVEYNKDYSNYTIIKAGE